MPYIQVSGRKSPRGKVGEQKKYKSRKKLRKKLRRIAKIAETIAEGITKNLGKSRKKTRENCGKKREKSRKIAGNRENRLSVYLSHHRRDIAQTFMADRPNDALQTHKVSGQKWPRGRVGGQKGLEHPERLG